MNGLLLVLPALLLSGAVLAHPVRPSRQSKPDSTTPEYKITKEDIDRTNPVKPTPEGIAEARKVFGYDCAMCHGEAGDGKGEVVESMKLDMHDWHDPASLAGKSDGELFHIITRGKGKMMAEGDRQTEKMRWNLVNLIRSIAAKPTPQKSASAAPNS
jgi:mono/diheme cytochrome c family protein